MQLQTKPKQKKRRKKKLKEDDDDDVKTFVNAIKKKPAGADDLYISAKPQTKTYPLYKMFQKLKKIIFEIFLNTLYIFMNMVVVF